MVAQEREKEEPLEGREELNLWIRGHIPTPSFTFFTKSPPFTLKDLHYTLDRAVRQISFKLDPELVCAITTAREDQHSIILNEHDFSDGRMLNVDELVNMDTGIESLSRDKVVQLLDLCRDEIEWERNEIHRLEVHCENAAIQKRYKIRETFQYRPVPRKERNVMPGVGVKDPDERRDCAREHSCNSLCEEENSDEEMLEADKAYEGDGEEEQKVERVDEAIA